MALGEALPARAEPVLAELLAARQLIAELYRRVEARDLQIAGTHRALYLAASIREFARLMTRWRVLLGLARRVLLGRTADVRRNVEIMLRQSGMPQALDGHVLWVAHPRTIFGLTRRWIWGGQPAVEGLLVLAIERRIDLFHDPALPSHEAVMRFISTGAVLE